MRGGGGGGGDRIIWCIQLHIKNLKKLGDFELKSDPHILNGWEMLFEYIHSYRAKLEQLDAFSNYINTILFEYIHSYRAKLEQLDAF